MRIGSLVLAGVAACHLVSTTAQATDATCTTATITGSYGMSGSTLSLEKPKDGQLRFDPLDEIAQVHFDSSGHAAIRAQTNVAQGPAVLKAPE